MRAFLAINLTKQLKQEIMTLTKERFKDLDKALKTKPVEEKNLHITLRFLGEINEDEKNNVVSQLKTVKVPKFTLEFNQIGYFSHNGLPRVIFLKAESKPFTELVLSIDEKLSLANIKFDKKPPVCHLTLYRVKYVKDRNLALNMLEPKTIQPFKLIVDSFELMKSTLSREGPTYSIINSFDLI
ncbi:MAG: 2,3-cyclic 3-phosphodiesterase [Candidatus Woesearchaeota archaeon]|nr:2,3-cyclic 3-phosphodiesterase [Candidatus Woesearchaeota archaeon]